MTLLLVRQLVASTNAQRGKLTRITAFHAVQSSKLRLEKAGFKAIKVNRSSSKREIPISLSRHTTGTRLVVESTARRQILPVAKWEHHCRICDRISMEGRQPHRDGRRSHRLLLLACEAHL
jgi:hypothetical protein